MSTVIGLDFDVKGLDKLQSAANLLDEVYQSNKPMIENSNTPSMVQSSIDNTDNKEQLLTMESFNNAIQNVTSSVRGLIDSFEKLQKETENNIRTEETAKISQTIDTATTERKEKSEKSEKSVQTLNDDQGAINSAQNIANLVTAVANQNVSGGIINTITTAGGSLRKKSSEMDTNTDEALQLAKMLGTAGTVAVIAGTALKVADVTAQKYEKALPGIDSLLQVYGSDNQNKGSSRLNANVGLDLRNELLDYNKGTGLSNEDFISYSTQLGRYGIDDVKKGGQITQDAAFWSRYTGMRMESALGFMGTVERLGGDGRKTLDEVYGNAIASGIDKNQFPEFLDGVQRAIETGVSQGFIRSAKDVSESLSLLSRLSGGDPTWQGEYGVQRYNQMVSGMANNTSLNSTASMIMYRAANNMVEAKGAKDLLGQNKFLQDNGANWINTMAYIEKGDLSGEFLSNLKKVVDANFGDNTASKVLTYKEQFGLNYQGAIEFYKALEKLGSGANEESIKSEIEKITQNKEFKSDNTKLLDALNSIDSSVVNLGQSTFNVKMNGLEALSGVVENIYKEIRKEKGYVQTAKALGKEFFLDSEDKTHLTYIGKMAEENRGEDEQYFIELDNVINSVPKHLRADLADRLKKLDPNTQKTAKEVYEFVKQIIEEDVLVPHWGRGNLNPNGTQTFLTPEGEASASDYLKFAQMGRLQAFANSYDYTVESLIEDILAIKTKNGGVKFENAYNKAAEGGFDENEKNQLSLLLEKILEELQSGINVN